MAAANTSIKRTMLQERYRNAGQKDIAYIDESYLAPNAHHAQSDTFYLMTACVLSAAVLEPIRLDLDSIIEEGYWHTTDAQRDPQLRPKVQELCDYIAVGGDEERIIVTVQSPIDPADTDAEEARARCFEELLVSLAELNPTVGLAVYEERRFQKQRSADERTIKQARRRSPSARALATFAASPSDEHLLWLPDVVSFALYQRHGATRWSHYATPFIERVHYIAVDAKKEAAPECRSNSNQGPPPLSQGEDDGLLRTQSNALPIKNTAT